MQGHSTNAAPTIKQPAACCVLHELRLPCAHPTGTVVQLHAGAAPQQGHVGQAPTCRVSAEVCLVTWKLNRLTR